MLCWLAVSPSKPLQSMLNAGCSSHDWYHDWRSQWQIHVVIALAANCWPNSFQTASVDAYHQQWYQSSVYHWQNKMDIFASWSLQAPFRHNKFCVWKQSSFSSSVCQSFSECRQLHWLIGERLKVGAWQVRIALRTVTRTSGSKPRNRFLSKEAVEAKQFCQKLKRR